MCGIIDGCGPDACRDGNCADEVTCYTCDCDEDYELMLLVNGSCAWPRNVKFSSRTRFSGADLDVNVKVC